MPTSIPGLRSPYDQVGGLYLFGRLLDKIRLHAVGQLPADYLPYLGELNPRTFDARCCHFLGIGYEALAAQAKSGLSDRDLLDWAYANGRKPSDEETEIWNAFVMKRGWRDDVTPLLQKMLVTYGFAPDAALTFFDAIELDECRPLRFPADPAPPTQPVRGKNHIPRLRSPHVKVGGLVQFGRMLDKIRLSAAGQLPPDWDSVRGTTQPLGFDNFCCRFLRLDYAALETETLQGGTDESLIAWAFTHGRKPTDEEIEIWNAFLSKRCWRDAYTHRLQFRLEEAGLPPGAALTMFDFIDIDEAAP